MKANRRWLVCALVAGVLAAVVILIVTVGRVRAAGIPRHSLVYTGYLENPDGTPLTDAVRNVALRIGDDGDSDVCNVPSQDVALVNGRFQVPLDDCEAAIAESPDLWVEVEVDGASLGRSKLGAVPYAVEAAHAVVADHAVAADEATHAGTAASANAASGDLASTLEAKLSANSVQGNAYSSDSSAPAGVKFKWQAGTTVGTSDGASHFPVQYPEAFAGGVQSVVVTGGNGDQTAVQGITGTLSRTGFVVVTSSSNATVRVNWIAIGW